MHNFFRNGDNRMYWGVLVAMQLLDMHEMPLSALNGLVEAVNFLRSNIDLHDVLPIEWDRMCEMDSVFAQKVAQRQKEIEIEREEASYF